MSLESSAPRLEPPQLTELLRRITAEETRGAVGSRFARRLSQGTVALDLPGALMATVKGAHPLGLRHHPSSLEGTAGRVRLLDALDRLRVDSATRGALLGEARAATRMMRQLFDAREPAGRDEHDRLQL
ncbi:MAG TPA: hypothetical protein VK539_33725 [Myxococcaceae bacterium]|nr:hypothetical protein [Myxococcaceae bacterium]